MLVGREMCNCEDCLLLPPKCGLHLPAQGKSWSFNTFLSAFDVYNTRLAWGCVVIIAFVGCLSSRVAIPDHP